MKIAASMSVGRLAPKHSLNIDGIRAISKNVTPKLIKNDVILINRLRGQDGKYMTIEEYTDQHFQPYIEQYNLKQRRKDNRNSVVAKFATTATDGKTYQVDYYNLDVIISIGYRVKSQRGVQFRIWATNILKEYMKKGFAIDDERLKNLGGGGYFRELLERIRDIRASEKVFYRQVLEIYATSIDYDPKAEISIEFFKKVQNKIHFAVSGKTAKSILISCGARLAPFDIAELREITAYDELELDTLGDRKTALFLIMSDTDATFNFLISMIYTQLFNLLCEKADDVYGGRLPVHIRCLIDEAANIGQIS